MSLEAPPRRPGAHPPPPAGEAGLLLRLMRRGAHSLEVDLPGGRVRWLDASGSPVGWARSRAVLLHAGAAQRATWAAAWPGAFAWATVAPLPGPAHREPIEVAAARRLAEAAVAAPQATVLRVAVQPGGQLDLYLAVSAAHLGDWPGGAAADPAPLAGWLGRQLRAAAARVERGDPTAGAILDGVIRACRRGAAAEGDGELAALAERLAALRSGPIARDPLAAAIALHREAARTPGGPDRPEEARRVS